MGWRFRRSIKVLPGVRLNVGKSGFTSVSVGGRGARMTFGKKGVSQTIGIPGTGIAFTRRITSPPAPSYQQPDRSNTPTSSRRTLLVLGFLLGTLIAASSMASESNAFALIAAVFALGCFWRLATNRPESTVSPAYLTGVTPPPPPDRPTPNQAALDSLKEVFGLTPPPPPVDVNLVAAGIKDEPNLATSANLSALFRSKFERVTPPPPHRHQFMAVVGESKYQKTLQQISALFETIGRTDRALTVKLVPEPTNQYDAHAVKVTTEGDATVGYLSRDVAKSYHLFIAAAPQPVTCLAKLTGGADDKPSIGVVLNFEAIYALRENQPR
jgi:hypothetical protein